MMNKPMIFAVALLVNMLCPSKASALLLCTVSATGLSFGSFSPLTGSTVDSTATITVFCDALANYTLTLSPGGSGTYTPRRMASGGNTLEYNLYRDAGRNQIWGNGTGGTYTVSGSIFLLGSNDHTVYGRIPLSTQRNAMVGSYSDSITVTVTY
ncbi:MAG: Csu type fimbrial protein [Gammaproteobacteria bacterium]